VSELSVNFVQKVFFLLVEFLINTATLKSAKKQQLLLINSPRSVRIAAVFFCSFPIMVKVVINKKFQLPRHERNIFAHVVEKSQEAAFSIFQSLIRNVQLQFPVF
jgi:hypothetical protein